MATRTQRGLAQRTNMLAKINRAGQDRARLICELIVQEIQNSPRTPYDATRREDRQLSEHLRNSYHVAQAGDGSGDWEVRTDVRYWSFVEFGTAEHGHAQPHVRPAIEIVRGLLS
jgi:hypothetical protein